MSLSSFLRLLSLSVFNTASSLPKVDGLATYTSAAMPSLASLATCLLSLVLAALTSPIVIVPPGGPAPFLRPASPFDPLQSADSPSILPTSPLSTDAEGKLHFDSRRWKVQQEGNKQVCMRDVYGTSAGFDLALKNHAFAKPREGSHVSISESFKLDYDTTRVFYIEACLPYGIKGWIGKEGGPLSGFNFDVGTKDNTTLKITEDRKVQSSSAKSPSAEEAEKAATEKATTEIL